ncbi:MAG: hypothetical protein WBA76_14145 [Phormidesmis sp.]
MAFPFANHLQDESPTVTVLGTVVAGHRVASGQAAQSPYPSGTIEMQTPHFAALGVDLTPFYPGTLNVSMAPSRFSLRPQTTLPQVKWSPHHAAESFSFLSIYLTWQQQTFGGLVYYPHPETKLNHFQDPSVLELLLPKIAGIAYGDRVKLTAAASDLIIQANL